MNRDQVEGKWKQAKGKIQEKWGKLTDDDFAKAKGERAHLVGRIQELYGDSRESVESALAMLERGANR